MTDMSPSRGSPFTCRNVGVVVALFLLVMWYLPKRLHNNQSRTADGWTMYPRHWVRTNIPEPSADRTFTIMSYNILNSGFIVEGTYTYCPRELLELRHRHPRIMVEVQTMNPDIVSMMEVDTEHYTTYLNPDMLKMGYNGVISADQKYSIGQATFWKKDKFLLVRRKYEFFHDLAKKYVDEAVAKKTLSPEEMEPFSDWMKRRSLVLMTVLQEVTSGMKVVVGAVHITWDILQLPGLQMLEIAVGLQALQDMAQSAGADSIIMMGDFNTPPHFPAYSFLREGLVSDSTRQSVMQKTDTGGILTKDYRRYGKTVLDIIPGAFHHKLRLSSAYYSVLGEEPEMTDADDFDSRAGMKGVQTYTLDYIWFTNSSLNIHSVLRTPPKEAILKYTGLPSVLFPSDHLPLQAKFSFK